MMPTPPETAHRGETMPRAAVAGGHVDDVRPASAREQALGRLSSAIATLDATLEDSLERLERELSPVLAVPIPPPPADPVASPPAPGDSANVAQLVELAQRIEHITDRTRSHLGTILARLEV